MFAYLALALSMLLGRKGVDIMKKQDITKRSDTGSLTRRSFLRTATMAAGAAAVGAPAIARAQNLNEKLDLALIGVGGRGMGNFNGVAQENIVALCDVNAKNLATAAKRAAMGAGEGAPEPIQEKDFRKIYDHADKFDAVVVSTCEHTHAFATLPALQLGKHVYCEKPLTHGIWEARVIRKAAAKAKVATQMGTQIHAGDNYRRVVELVQTGAIGPVRECHVWVSRAWGWHATEEEAIKANDLLSVGDQKVFVQERPEESMPIPEQLDWDLWIGPAPMRPYHEIYFPGPKWYRWWDFGSGTMSDLGSHWIDLPFWALKLDVPLTIEAEGPPPHPELAPASMQATYEYAARGDMPAVKLTWYQGVNKPQIWKDGGIPKWDSGVLFIGDKGMLLSDYGRNVLLPEEQYKDFEPPEQFIPKSLGHHAEWIHACKTGDPTTCHFEYAGMLTEANHLGNVAYRTGKKIVWDAKNLKAEGVPEADKIIHRAYREGWKLI